MPPPNTPAESCGANVARFPQDVGLPRFDVGSASAKTFRGLLGVHCTLRPACSLSPQGTLFLEVLQSKSLPPSAASSATGRSDRNRVGITPTENQCLSTAHVKDHPRIYLDAAAAIRFPIALRPPLLTARTRIKSAREPHRAHGCQLSSQQQVSATKATSNKLHLARR